MPRTKKCAEGRVRWGHLCELDRRTNVGTEAWHRRHAELRLKKLSAWRGLHAVYGSHPSVRGAMLRQGIGRPSSNAPLSTMMATIRKKTGRS